MQQQESEVLEKEEKIKDFSKEPEIQTWDPKSMKDRQNFAALIVAKRNSGKSVFLKDLMSKIHSWYDDIYVFSLTASMQPDLFNWVDESNVINHFDQQRLLEIWEEQEALVKAHRSDPLLKKKKIPKIMIIFDDIISDPKVRQSPILNRYLVCGRHNSCSVIILTQSLSGKFAIPMIIRQNVDLMISFWLNAEYDRKQLISQYLSTRSIKEGEELYASITQESFVACVIENYKTTKNYSDYVKKYKAELKVKDFSHKTDINGDYKNGPTIVNFNFGKGSNLFIKPKG